MTNLVYGLGESGVPAIEALLARGEVALATDANAGGRAHLVAADLGVEFRPATAPDALAGVDRLVVSPGVRPSDPLLRAAGEGGVPIISEVALGLELLGDGVRVVGITGTNGKTTVVDMLDRLLTAADVPHAVAGNSWRALTGCLDEVRASGLLVLEVSSFQLHYTSEPGFDVAALLNTRPDHMDWHASFEEYRRDKLRVFEGQEAGGLALVSAGDPVGREAARDLTAGTLIVGEGDTAVRDGALLLHGSPIADAGELSFAGTHNHENALFAAVAAERMGAPRGDIRDGLLGYRLKAHRMEVVAEVGGVTYVDDSKATNPAAVAAALGGLDRPVLLILGGSEKYTDFSEILPHLGRCRVALCQGEAGPRIADYLEGRGHAGIVERLEDLDAAVGRASKVARTGDAVLLSPGCASFDRFAGYAERGDAFARLAREATRRQGVVGR